jgi:hypothetical protein
VSLLVNVSSSFILRCLLHAASYLLVRGFYSQFPKKLELKGEGAALFSQKVLGFLDGILVWLITHILFSRSSALPQFNIFVMVLDLVGVDVKVGGCQGLWKEMNYTK